jgi:hypothetical protein
MVHKFSAFYVASWLTTFLQRIPPVNLIYKLTQYFHTTRVNNHVPSISISLKWVAGFSNSNFVCMYFYHGRFPWLTILSVEKYRSRCPALWNSHYPTLSTYVQILSSAHWLQMPSNYVLSLGWEDCEQYHTKTPVSQDETPNCWLSGFRYFKRVFVFIFEVMGLEPLKTKVTWSFKMTWMTYPATQLHMSKVQNHQ